MKTEVLCMECGDGYMVMPWRRWVFNITTSEGEEKHICFDCFWSNHARARVPYNTPVTTIVQPASGQW